MDSPRSLSEKTRTKKQKKASKKRKVKKVTFSDNESINSEAEERLSYNPHPSAPPVREKESDFIFLVQILGAVGLGILVGYLIERYLRKKEEEETRKQKEEEDRQFYQTSEPPGILDDISPLGYVAIGTAGAFALVAGYELLGKRTGLFTRGLTKTVRGDGNCFYRSIAEFVYGDQRFWEKVKRELKEFSESGRSDVVNMLKAMGGSEYDDVKQLLNKPNEWARGPIIQLAREYYKPRS
jgi:F0F1-type ATP synthase assembly protein I